MMKSKISTNEKKQRIEIQRHATTATKTPAREMEIPF